MRISVVIPFYNLANYVRETLDSVLSSIRHFTASALGGQTLSVEVICVDDGSTDETGRLIDAYGEESKGRAQGQEGNFSFIVVHKQNGGEGSARNAGLAVATGEWVTFLDGDDVWLPNMLTSFADLAGRHPQADIIGFKFLPFEDGSPLPSQPMGTDPQLLFDTRKEIPSEAILDLGVFPTFFRCEKFKDIVFSPLPLGADRLYVAQCLAKADRVVMSPAGVHGYRVRAGSMARAVWNERKIKSMIDFASGSLAAFSASGKRVGRRGARYLGDVLFSVAPKQIRRMEGDKKAIRSYWLRVLAAQDGTRLSFVQKIYRWWQTRNQ